MSADDDGATDAVALCTALRATMLSCRDSARLLAVSPLVGSAEALALMERLLGALTGVVPPDLVAAAGDTLMSYVTGFVLQEQMPPAEFPPGDLAARFPLVHGAPRPDGPDALFTAAVTAIVDGFAAGRGR